MRKRSNTIQADNVDNYMDVLHRIDSTKTRRLKPSKKHLNQDALNKKQSGFGASSLNKKPAFGKENKENHIDDWSNFDFDCDSSEAVNSHKNRPEAFSVPSLAFSDNTVDTDCSDDVERSFVKGLKTSVVKRVMVVGLNNSGKHALINSTFECGEKPLERSNQVMDLLMKAEQDEEETQVRYQFWIRTLHADENLNKKFEDLLRVYYKSVSLFVFMYSITDRKSFDMLGSAIQSVMKEVPEGKFAGVLLGNKSDLEKEREVTTTEGMSLQEKYKLTFFIETNQEDRRLKDKLVQVLHDIEGGLGDMQTKKGHSILSIE